MTALPRGTVIFLMTDIEGSTQLVASLGEDFARALDDHFALLDAVVNANGGHVVSSEGDSLFAVFTSAREAIAAAIAGQRALAAHTWPADAVIKVRMGLHAGEAMLGGRDYTGLDVHRASRIAAAAWGGEVLASDAVRTLAGTGIAEGVSFRDLGVHTLRDIPAPERLFQLCAPDLAVEFPPPRAVTVASPTNLPAALTRFIGRTRELAAVRGLLADQRLVTLTGPGGTGKTRLAIEAARSLLDAYPDGTWFVALDAVRDATLVAPSIAQTLGVRDQPGRPMTAVLAESLAAKRTLLVLDNLEQVIAAAPDIAALLHATELVAVLGSSRESLAVAGEYVYRVPPLGLPSEPGRPTAAEIAHLEAVDLFVERARAARPDFALDDANAPAVAAICRRVDGLPLAIELAAARVNVLAPEQILARLDHRLTLLASSHRDLPDRQRTLRGAIAWSYDLLDKPSRAFLSRFSVFAAGADFDAVSAIVDPDGQLGADVLDISSALVDRSLLLSTNFGDQNRFEMLETIREYAAERLSEAGEEAEVRARHAAYFRALVEPLSGLMVDPRREQILNELERELPNLRAAITWSLETREFETGFTILIELHDYWHIRDHLPEARRLLEQLLAASADAGATPIRASATQVAAELASWSFDYGAADELGRRAIMLAEAAGDPRTLMSAHMAMGWANVQSHGETAVEHFDRAIDLARALEDDRTLSISLGGKSVALINLGAMGRADASARESLAISQRIGDDYNEANAHASLALIAAANGDLDAAVHGFQTVVRKSHEIGGHIMVVVGLDGLAYVELERGDPASAARLSVAADQLRQAIGGGPTLALAGLAPPLERARLAMDPAEFELAVAEGLALSTDEVVASVLSQPPSQTA